MESEATPTQFIEYLFDDDQEQDWVNEDYQFKEAELKLTIRTRYTTTGISRVSLSLEDLLITVNMGGSFHHGQVSRLAVGI